MAAKTGRSGRRRQRLLILLLIPPAAVSVFLHVSRFSRSLDVHMAQERYSALVRERPIEATKARRARFYQIRYYLAYPMAASYAAADFVRRVEAGARPLRLLHVQVDPGLHDMSFTLAVAVEAASLEAARRKFAVVFEKIRLQAGVTEASFAMGGGEAGGRHSFVVDGRAEIQP